MAAGPDLTGRDAGRGNRRERHRGRAPGPRPFERGRSRIATTGRCPASHLCLAPGHAGAERILESAPPLGSRGRRSPTTGTGEDDPVTRSKSTVEEHSWPTPP